MKLPFGFVLVLCLSFSSFVQADDHSTVTDAVKDKHGFLVHEVRSSFQATVTQICLLFPDKFDRKTPLPVVYVLPVEAGNEDRYGNGLLEIKKLDLHNHLNVVFVAPTFSHLPWYADHPSRAEIRQESYLCKVVIPFIDRTYPVQREAKGRHLLGFSKSGWGAWSLLLRNPELFGRAVAWDAPLMMEKPGKYGSGEIFGPAENFERFRVSKLLASKADLFHKEKRLFLYGYGNFRAEHEQAHSLMNRLKIVHDYQDGPFRKHNWHSGWVKDAVQRLVGR